MSIHGKTVRIYLADGSPSGIRHAEVVNWTGQAIACPRKRVGELAKWGESQRPGLYILLGEDPERQRALAYIGEAENVFTRLRQHVVSKEFWDHVVFFTSKDENLTKSHVKYLESRIIEMATQARRIHLENGSAPVRPTLPRSERDAMEEFIEPLRILLGVLGITLLEQVRQFTGSELSGRTEQATEDESPLGQVTWIFEVPRTGVRAEGVSTDEGFVVLAGSVGSLEIKDTLSPGWVRLRNELLDEGSIVAEGSRVRFVKDVLFKSPSAAASIVCGRNQNGRNGWKDKSGITLGEIEDALVSGAETVEADS